MLDPFSYWSRVFSSWQAIGLAGQRIAETATASHDVIASRSATIGEAIASPATADHAELMRMVPEKVAAFSQAGESMMRAGLAMQADYFRHMQHVGAMMTQGRPPSAAAWFDLSNRSANYALRALEASARVGANAVKPVHRTATANAKRLKSADRKKRAALPRWPS